MSSKRVIDVTVCTAHIPPRGSYLSRAVMSVASQTVSPKEHLISVDYNKLGQPANLDRCVWSAKTKYVAILDDDDEMLPDHLESLYDHIESTGADLVYPWIMFETSGNAGHLEEFAFKDWSNDDFHTIPITWMARTDVVKSVGGFSGGFDPHSFNVDEKGFRIGSDRNITRKMVDAGFVIKHMPKVTWIYHDRHARTNGMPSRW